MSSFISSLFGYATAGQQSTSAGGLGSKLLVPALLATSVGLYWQYSSCKASKSEDLEQDFDQLKRSEFKRIQKMMAKLPATVKDLSNFTPPEIQAITRRNTIKNKLVGRIRQFCLTKQANNITSEINSSENTINEEAKETLSSEEKWIINITKAQIVWDEKQINFGSDSVLSTGSVATASSEFDQRNENITSILKSMCSVRSVKRVSFAI